MSELSNPGDNGSSVSRIKPSRRRDKIQVSCMTCRQKKLKCDRLKPCGNCIKRGQPASCDYPKAGVARDRNGGLHTPVNVQEKVKHLEELVMSLMKTREDSGFDSLAHESSSTASPQNPIRGDGFEIDTVSSLGDQMESNSQVESLGKLTKGKNKTSFVGSGHWEAILEDIAELKNHFDEGHERNDEHISNAHEPNDFEPRILLGPQNHASRAEIMSSIPTRPICDRLISRYFNSMDVAPMILHAPTFLKEYNRMWINPESVSLVWVGLLFAVLGLASNFHFTSGDEIHSIPEPFNSLPEMASHYRDRTAQCLVSSNYLKPVRYTVETLLCYYALELFTARDTEFSAWIVLGIIVRVSMRLGYHRDASHYSNISPFDGEMQRRVWSTIVQLDLVNSTQVGLPRMIRETETDTAEPKNLLDTDFDENMAELPPPRPSTDATPVSYAIFKNRLLRVLGLIVDESTSINSLSYSDTMKLDVQVIATYDAFPPYLISRPLSASITDNPDVIMRRLMLETCFQKARCVLHRQYLIPAQTNPHYRYSRSSCIDAAMKLLSIQSDFYDASQPGGQLFRDRWRINSMVNQDYVLAAMILCLDLDWRMKHGKDITCDEEDESEVIWPRQSRLQSLNRSFEILNASSTTSKMAAKAAESLKIIMKRLKIETAGSGVTIPKILSNLSVALSNDSDSADLQDSVRTLPFNLLPEQRTRLEHFSSPKFDTESSFLMPDLMTGMIDTGVNFDWGLWDSHFQTTSTTSMPPGHDDIESFTYQG